MVTETTSIELPIMASEAAGIGFLAQLPREVRDLIWKQFTPSKGQQTNLSILRTCHQLYEEISPLLYKNEVLRFQISPTFQYQSWLSITTRRGAEFHLRDLTDAISRGFVNLPYKRLEEIKVEIEAPASADPGQVVCLWKKVTNLVDLLSQAGGLPNVKIHLQNSGLARWSTEGKAQKSIPHQDDLYNIPGAYDPDFEAILEPFCRLRNISRASVHIPEVILGQGHLIENYAAIMMMTEPFGILKDDDDDGWGDDKAQIYLDTTHLQFDTALDDLPGQTARMMRLDRFSSWYTDGLGSESQYLNELERVYHGKHFAGFIDKFDIENRYLLMMTFNPMSGKMQQMQGRVDKTSKQPYLWNENEWTQYRDHERRLNSAGSECDSENEDEADPLWWKDEWDKDSWHRYYADGIPSLNCKSTRLFHEQMRERGAYWYDKEWLDRFNEKELDS